MLSVSDRLRESDSGRYTS